MADIGEVREALRRELSALGFDVQSDSHGTGRSLYLMGDRDLAIALFEVHAMARDAIEAMYHGAWTEGLPPRFAVLPSAAREAPDFEMLEQMRITPLLFDEGDGAVTFPDLDRAMRELLPRSG